MNELRIATRGSKLALWQAEHVRARLIEHAPDLAVSLVVLKTQGDKILDRPLSEIGGKGLFTKEIEEALLDGRADLAVHSMKDMPAQMPPGLILGAVPERADPLDALVLPSGKPAPAPGSSAGALLHALPPGARVGTSSLRRICQLMRLRPDLQYVALRGNVDTRLRKLDEGEFDAVVLASAGLVRLGFAARISARFSPAEMLPACGQGALGLQCREDDSAVLGRLERFIDESATAAVQAERAFSHRLLGNCQTPLGAYATLRAAPGGKTVLHIDGMVGSPSGDKLVRDALSGPVAEAAELGRGLAERLLDAGAAELIK